MACLDPSLQSAVEKAGQGDILRFFSELDDSSRERFAAQLKAIDWEALPDLARQYVLRRPETTIPDDLAPAVYYPLIPRDAEMKALYEKAAETGKQLLRDGKVCCLTVAGGQGTRLGFDGPKGTYPIGPVTGRTLFEYFSGNIRRMGEKYGHPIPWYVMTSPINREATESFFSAKNFFGLPQEQIFFFTQGTMPAFDRQGKLLLSAKDSLALSPDGHGGTLLALRKSGALAKMAADGTEFVSYFQVDNPLVPVADPLFIGLTALDNAEVGAIVLTKTGPHEKLGNFCVSGGRTRIIEYSDLPDALAEKCNPDGSLAFSAGSPAIHVFRRDFIDRLTEGNSLRLPWHRADKKIASLDAQGNLLKPDEPNGVKLESFIFDALPLAQNVLLLAGERKELFAPTKNAVGVDSAESCRVMISERNARRLAAAGVEIPRNPDGSCAAAIEISPYLVCDDEDALSLVGKTGLKAIIRGENLAL